MTEACRILDTTVAPTRGPGGSSIPGDPVERAMRHPYCRIAPAGADGRERVIADQLQALDLMRVRVTYDQAVEASDVFEARGETFEIVQVDPLRTNAVDRSIYVRRQS